MIRSEPHVVKGLARAVQEHPEFLAWMEDALAYELKRLPYAVENPAVFQGRCQMLVELIGFIKEAPAVAAKSVDSPSNSNHAYR